MEIWELQARESIRDIVARYNSNGDTGRFEEVLELFADDATMEVVSPKRGRRLYRGRDQIATIFEDAKQRWSASAAERTAPAYVRHYVSTHQIDLIDTTHAKGRCYFQVLMPHGLDHWGHYMDEFEQRGGRWLFTYRRAEVDGATPGSVD